MSPVPDMGPPSVAPEAGTCKGSDHATGVTSLSTKPGIRHSNQPLSGSKAMTILKPLDFVLDCLFGRRADCRATRKLRQRLWMA